MRIFSLKRSCVVLAASSAMIAPQLYAQDVGCGEESFKPSVKVKKYVKKSGVKKASAATPQWRSAAKHSLAMKARVQAMPKAFIRLRPNVEYSSQTKILDSIGQVEVVDAQGRAKSAISSDGAPSLVNGDVIRTAPKSYVRLLTRDGTFVNIASASHLKLTQIDKLPIRLELTQGRIESLVHKQNPLSTTSKKPNTKNPNANSSYQIKTPAVTLSVRGTRFKVEHLLEPIETSASVEDGVVAVQRAGTCDAPIVLSQGMGVVVSAQSANVYDMLPAPEALPIPPVIKGDTLAIELKPVKGALRYRMQVGYDEPSLLINDEVVSELPKLALHNLPNGYYFVRYNAIDAEGVEGASDQTTVLYQPD